MRTPETMSCQYELPKKNDAELELKRAVLHTNIQNWISKNFPEIQHCAATIILFQMLDEFLKNSIDAEATTLAIRFETKEINRILFYLKDNGSKPISTELHGPYNWRAALSRESTKTESDLGGKHLGLAICANFLEKEGQNGSLYLNPNTDQLGGTTIILESGNHSLGEIDVRPERLNCAHMMTLDMQNTPGSVTQEIIESLFAKYPLKPGETVRRTPCITNPSRHSSMFSPTSPPGEPSDSGSFVTPLSTAIGGKKRKPPSLFVALPMQGNTKSMGTEQIRTPADPTQLLEQ